jgi:hypothetical protein
MAHAGLCSGFFIKKGYFMLSDEKLIRRLYENDPENILYRAVLRLYQLRRSSLYQDYEIPEKAVNNLEVFFKNNHLQHLTGISILFIKEKGSFVVLFQNNKASFFVLIGHEEEMYFHFKKKNYFYAVRGKFKVDSYLCNEVAEVLWEDHHTMYKKFIDVKKQCEKILDRVTPGHGLELTFLKHGQN